MIFGDKTLTLQISMGGGGEGDPTPTYCINGYWATEGLLIN